MKDQDKIESHHEKGMKRDASNNNCLKSKVEDLNEIKPSDCGSLGRYLNSTSDSTVTEPQNTLKTKFSSLRNITYCISETGKCSNVTTKFNLRGLPKVHLQERNTVLPQSQSEVTGVNLIGYKKYSDTSDLTSTTTSCTNLNCVIVKNSNVDDRLSTYLSDLPSELICRICHEGDNEEIFISPCKCSGSLGLVHKSCLEKWLSGNEGRQNKCELCNSIIPVERIPRPFYEYFKGNKNRLRNLYMDLFFIFFWIPLVVFSNIYNIRLNKSMRASSHRHKNVTVIPTTTSSYPVEDVYERIRKMKISELQDNDFSDEPLELMLLALFTLLVEVILIGWIVFSFWESVSNFIAWRKNNCVVRVRLQ